jgi:hypothetical protein
VRPPASRIASSRLQVGGIGQGFGLRSLEQFLSKNGITVSACVLLNAMAFERVVRQPLALDD